MIAEATTPQSFQQVQPYLFSVAYRMTGSASDAEDLVQDAWIRYLDAGSPAVTSLRAYLTTIVSRLSLDHLRAARVRREQYLGEWLPEPVLTDVALGDPAASVEQRESVSLAFLTLMERLSPEQRVVYVLREGLGLPYDEIATHVDKTSAACRQIYRRAQLRLGDEDKPAIVSESEHRQLVERFLYAVQTGDASRVAEVLAEDVVMVSDGGANRLATRRPIEGVDKVSRGLAGLARKGAEELQRLSISFVDINGAVAIVLHDEARVDRVFAFDIRDGKIAGLHGVLNPDKLRHLGRELGLSSDVAV